MELLTFFTTQQLQTQCLPDDIPVDLSAITILVSPLILIGSAQAILVSRPVNSSGAAGLRGRRSLCAATSSAPAPALGEY